MTITAHVICDNRGPSGSRLTTVLARYPLIIHNEVMTHRDFSRNAASSRAIPFAKMITDVKDNPFIPLVWTKNEPGMQGYEELSPSEAKLAELYWQHGLDHALETARRLNGLNCHKQIVNRVLGPYMYITVLITSSRWGNFLAVRLHKSAEPHMKILADRIWGALQRSTPKLLNVGDWHLPFVSEITSVSDAIKLSVARCASTSYKTVDGFDMTLKRAMTIHDTLLAARPVHASPAEHQACADILDRPMSHNGNLGPGWVQYRKTLDKEYTTNEEFLDLASSDAWPEYCGSGGERVDGIRQEE